jgi:steroid delta-isomerase-like uncharacterized protein
MSSAAQIHQQMVNAWNARDYDTMQSLLHPDYTYTGGDGKEMRGPEAGMAIARMYAAAFPDGRIEVQRVYTQGDTAVAEFVARGTHGGELMGIAPTGRAVEINICNVMELRDGKIHREREYFDMLTMLTQLGVATQAAHATAS